jgi:pimeloyl-ACP methyl ester carboxylesterase
VAGALYNAISIRRLMSRYPVPGNFYQVNGSKMHLYCIGTGSPAVLLESGLGSNWLYWQKVQPELAKTTRVCSYDRAGLGWSDLQPGPRDTKNIAAQLHSLLLQAGETGPLVLAGASAGGFYARVFAATYPMEVVGLVFVDSSSPEQIEALPGAKDSDEQRRKRHRDAAWDWVKQASGWARLLGHCKGSVDSGLEAYADIARAADCRPSFATSWLGEWDNFWRSGEEVAKAPCCGNVPILVVSQDPDRPKPGWSAQQIAAQPIWSSIQEHLKSLSPHSRRIIARGSRHHVLIDRPDVIITGTERLVIQIRNKTADPQEGTTVVQ